MKTEMIGPMLCEVSQQPFDNPNFIYETKFDGERVIFIIDRNEDYFRIQNRREFDITERFSEFRDFDFLNDNVVNIILDGELLLNEGKSNDYHNPQFKMRTATKSSIKSNFLSKIVPLKFFVFDILFLNGEDLRQLPLLERKKKLRENIRETDRVKIVDFVENTGISFYQKLISEGFEGVVAKEKNSVYENKRSSNWLKMKPIHETECVVLGWNEKSGRSSYGSVRTDKGDVGLLKMENKKEFDELVEKYGLGNFKVKASYQEILSSGKMRFPLFKNWITNSENNSR